MNIIDHEWTVCGTRYRLVRADESAAPKVQFFHDGVGWVTQPGEVWTAIPLEMVRLVEDNAGLQLARAAALEICAKQEEEIQELKRQIHLATQDACTCGGMGPNDPGVCPACEVWHALKGAQTSARVVVGCDPAQPGGGRTVFGSVTLGGTYRSGEGFSVEAPPEAERAVADAIREAHGDLKAFDAGLSGTGWVRDGRVIRREGEGVPVDTALLRHVLVQLARREVVWNDPAAVENALNGILEPEAPPEEPKENPRHPSREDAIREALKGATKPPITMDDIDSCNAKRAERARIRNEFLLWLADRSFNEPFTEALDRICPLADDVFEPKEVAVLLYTINDKSENVAIKRPGFEAHELPNGARNIRIELRYHLPHHPDSLPPTDG